VAYLRDPDFETQGSNNIRPKRRPKDWLLDRYTMLCYQYRVKYQFDLQRMACAPGT